MNTRTQSIRPTDVIAVTLQNGIVMTTLTLSGLSALGEVMKEVRTQASEVAGVVKVVIRNRTQGWAQQHTIISRAPGSLSGVRTERRLWA